MTKSDKPGPDAARRAGPFRPKKLKTALSKPQAEAPEPVRKDAERIAKVMARVGVASRREAEAWITDGRVAVNGKTITSPALNVSAADKITLDGRPLQSKERTRLFLFNKPRGVVTTSVDTHDRPTIYEVLPEGLPRLISVGRLDLNTEGLLLLTNDGGLARALELPSTGWLRRYRVRAFGRIAQPQLDALRKGIEVDGVQYGAIEATLEREQGDNAWLTFAMREGKNREIRNVMRALGLQVNRLIRVSYGPFQLADLPDGAVEEVKTRTLRDQLGDKLTALAGADFAAPVREPTVQSGAPHQERDRGSARDRLRRPASSDGKRPAGPRGRDSERPASNAKSGERSKRSPGGERVRDPKGRLQGDRTRPARSHERSRSDEGRGQRDRAPEPRTPKAPQHRSHRPHRGKGSGPRPSRPKS